MDWISENLFWFLFIAGGILSWINTARKEKATRGTREVTEASAEKTEEADVRNEILRKIAERSGPRANTEARELPEFLFEKLESEKSISLLSPDPEVFVHVKGEQSQEPSLHSRGGTRAGSIVFDGDSAYEIDTLGKKKAVLDISCILKDTNKIRKSILLSEVLGPPLGLKK